MEIITRRAALQKLAKLSVAAAAAPLIDGLTGCCFSRQANLNVVLHGLYVLNFTKTGVDLLTPDIKDHVYLAGNWSWKPCELLKENQPFDLRGATENLILPHLDLPYNLLFPYPDLRHSIDPTYSRHSVTMPLPQSVRLLRITDDGANIASKSNNTLTINQLSLCQVLTYHVADWCKLRLTGTNWKPQLDSVTRTVNLHFWAEPLYRVPFQHAQHAYNGLSKLLGACLSLGTDKSSPLDLTPTAYGLSREHEQGLSEWYTAGEGSHPTNCSTVMVDSTQTISNS